MKRYKVVSEIFLLISYNSLIVQVPEKMNELVALNPVRTVSRSIEKNINFMLNKKIKINI